MEKQGFNDETDKKKLRKNTSKQGVNLQQKLLSKITLYSIQSILIKHAHAELTE